jgi:dTDP-4-amino-4,6-dideoxygalactose transaminase
MSRQIKPNRPSRDPPANIARRQIGVGGFRASARAKTLVLEVLESNRITAGPMMSRFESQIASLHGCAFGLMSNSGTSALQIALGALKEIHGWQDGDEVLVPALTFVATANVVIYNRLVPVFVDVEPQYYDMDPAQIERRLTRRTRAIMPVHIGGLPCDMDPIIQIAQKHQLRIVEDSGETMFAKYRGRPVGSFGDAGCFSTYTAHIITTGIGGVSVTNDPELLVIMKSIMNHGRDSIYIRMDDDAGLTGRDLFEIVDRRFSFVRLGHSFRATEMEAALGIAQLEEREAQWETRQSLARRYNDGLADLADRLQCPSVRDGCDHAYMFYPLVLRDLERPRAHLIQYLEDRGVETRYLLPLINQPVYRRIFGNLDCEYPVAASLNESAFYIGSHPEMTESDVDYVVDCLHSYFSTAE